MGEVWVRALMVMFGSAVGSTGLWTFLRSRDTNRKAKDRLTMGLAQAQIVALGLQYLDRGSVTHDEYENLYTYLFKPYKELGGNGPAERVMRRVADLPTRPHTSHAEIFRNREEGWVNNVRVVSSSSPAATSTPE